MSSLKPIMSRYPKRAVHRPIQLFFACTLLLVVGNLSAETPSGIMSRAMIAMMDVMGNLAHQYKGKGNWSLGNNYSPYNGWSGQSANPWRLYGAPGVFTPGSGWPGGMPLQSPVPGYGGMPLQGLNPYASPFIDPLPAKSAVDGIWLGQSGELVLVMYGHFRIYASAEVYRDGRFEIYDNKLLMYDPETDRRMEFDYVLDNGRMILRSETGLLMLFKQLPIPIPPTTLFSNNPSTYQ